MEAYIAEYGSITLSAPLLSAPDKALDFDLNRKTTDYFDEAKREVQGASASFSEQVQSLALGLGVQADPTVAAAYLQELSGYGSDVARLRLKQQLKDSAALSDYRAALQAANQEEDPAEKAKLIAERPTFPTAATDGSGVPALPSGLAKAPEAARAPLSSDDFAGPGGLIAGLGVTPTASNREAIITVQPLKPTDRAVLKSVIKRGTTVEERTLEVPKNAALDKVIPAFSAITRSDIERDKPPAPGEEASVSVNVQAAAPTN
ncbi:MAG: hypothetical protein IPK07_27955 [Deltaproteobacteria bacterium]|nr:hypothetical protein [Deltaproteobacteria bacterium]